MSSVMAARRAPQYLAVQKNLLKLTRSLEGTDRAEKTLLDAFKAEGWLDQLSQTKANGLLTKALSKIENKAENYEVFIQMLQEVSGIEDAVEMITST